METDSDSIDDDLNAQLNDGDAGQDKADWGKTKYNYYYTDYVDKDYPSKLTAKEERAAADEQEDALRIQKKLLSTLDNVNLDSVFDEQDEDSHGDESSNLLKLIEDQNKLFEDSQQAKKEVARKRKRLRFEDEQVESDNEQVSDNEDEEGDEDQDQSDDGSEIGVKHGASSRQRRPIDMAIRKNRGLTPYKKKEYRNPRVKHKLKYKKAISKRRRNVQEAQSEYHRYSGETTGIKTSTVKSIKLC